MNKDNKKNYNEKLKYNEKLNNGMKNKKTFVYGTLFFISVLCNLIFVIQMNQNQEGLKKDKIVASAAELDENYFLSSVGVTTNGAIVSAASTGSNTTATVVGTKVTVGVNYLTSRIEVREGSGGSTQFYISKDKMKSWELLTLDSNKTIELAGYMKTSEVRLYFKGNKDIQPVEVIIPKEQTDLKIKYVVTTNGGKLEYSKAETLLQFRRSASESWLDVNSNTLKVNEYEDTGISLQFRVKATAVTRAGKIINVKIPKRPNVTAVKIDFNKMQISGLKDGVTYYRIGATGTFKLFNTKDHKDKVIDLAALLIPTGTDPTKTTFKGSSIEFYTAANSKKVKSVTKIVDFNDQPAAPTAPSLVGTTLTIADATKDKPYEYVIIKTTEVDGFNINTAKWLKVTSAKPIVLKKTGSAKTVPGDVVYVRFASVTDKSTMRITPPSLCVKKTVSSLTP